MCKLWFYVFQRLLYTCLLSIWSLMVENKSISARLSYIGAISRNRSMIFFIRVFCIMKCDEVKGIVFIYR